jgi:hypothetical protein
MIQRYGVQIIVGVMYQELKDSLVLRPNHLGQDNNLEWWL